MPKQKETETQYLDIKDLPKSTRGAKQISEEFIKIIQTIPQGKALEVEMKYSTMQGRIRNLTEQKRLSGNFKVYQRKTTEGTTKVYIAHID